MIGLFLGEKELPLKILSTLKRKKLNFFIIDLTKTNKFKLEKNIEKNFTPNFSMIESKRFQISKIKKAITDSNEDNGCMRMWPGSHKNNLRYHNQKFDQNKCY